jgi:hypothetical protein
MEDVDAMEEFWTNKINECLDFSSIEIIRIQTGKIRFAKRSPISNQSM